MRRAATSILGARRPIVIAEYPYYRIGAEHWEPNIAALRAAGADVISCYLPWRFHEQPGRAECRCDFTGERHPQTNVLRLMRLVRENAMKVLLKPGPFIHAEVQLGGLPDRVCADGDYAARIGLDGHALSSQGRALPSFFGTRFREDAAAWLRAVAEQVVAPEFTPRGAVAAIQLGNEGVYSDAALPLDREDVSPPALEAFRAWVRQHGENRPAPDPGAHRDGWGSAEWSLWGTWAGVSLVAHLHWIAGFFPFDLPKLVNMPLVRPDAPRNAAAGWLARHRALRRSDFVLGHTEWIGNAARDASVFDAHVLELLQGGTDTFEANWGFTWTDSTFAAPEVPLFHALLGLMLGSSTSSVYVACAGSDWRPEIDLDADGLRRDGLDAALYGPPYCPGAPLREDGGENPNMRGLTRLRAFIDACGAALSTTALTLEPEICAALEAPLDLRPSAPRCALASAAEQVHRLLAGRAAAGFDVAAGRATLHVQALSGHAAILSRTSGDGANVFLGLFNPAAQPGQVQVRGIGLSGPIELQPHCACVLHVEHGRLAHSILAGAAQGVPG